MTYIVERFRKIPFEKLENIINGLVEVKLIKTFNIIRETLTRIGTLEDGVLIQKTHILHKKGKYYILHYKQLMELDGTNVVISEDEYLDTYKTIYILAKWGLIEIEKYDDKKRVEMCKDRYIDIVRLHDIKYNGITTRKAYDL